MFLSNLNIVKRLSKGVDRFFSEEDEDAFSGDINEVWDFQASMSDNHFEWELHQRVIDIAAKDIETLFLRITPHLIRKAIVKIHYLVWFYFNIDEESVIKPLTSGIQHINNNDINNRFKYFAKGYHINSRQFYCYLHFTERIKALTRTIFNLTGIAIVRKVYTLTSSLHSNHLPLFARIRESNPIRGPGVIKFRSNHIFHKRN